MDEIDAWLAHKGRNLPVAMDEDDLAELAAEMREDRVMGLGATEDDYVEHDPDEVDEFDDVEELFGPDELDLE